MVAYGGLTISLGGVDMTHMFWPFPEAGVFVEPFLRGLVLALLAIVGIWAAAELANKIAVYANSHGRNLKDGFNRLRDRHA